MASVTPKSNGTYLIRISCGVDMVGKQITRSRVFKPSKPHLPYSKLNKEIENFIKAFEDDVARNEIPDRPEKIYFAAFSEQYLEIKKRTISPTTYSFYEKVVRELLVPMFGRMKMKDIRTYHIQQFIQYLCNEKPRGDGLEGHLAPPTVKRYTTVLRSMLTLAYKLEYIDEDVGISRRIEFPKEDRAEVEVFTMEEVGQILEATETEPIQIQTLIEVALFTGMRRGEIVGLKWEDVDFEKQTVSVKRSIYKPKGEKAIEKPPKSKSSIRTMAIPNRLCDTLRAYKEHQDRHASFMGENWNPQGYIFTEECGYVMNPQTPTKQFDHFLKRHNIRHLKFHGLRHTSATLLLANGCDIKTVSTRLGHADIDTTNIYVHALDTTDRNAANTFDQFVKGELQ